MVQGSLIPDPPASEIDGNGSRVTVSKERGVDKGEGACAQKRSPVLAAWRSALLGVSPMEVAFQVSRLWNPSWRRKAAAQRWVRVRTMKAARPGSLASRRFFPGRVLPAVSSEITGPPAAGLPTNG